MLANLSAHAVSRKDTNQYTITFQYIPPQTISKGMETVPIRRRRRIMIVTKMTTMMMILKPTGIIIKTRYTWVEVGERETRGEHRRCW